MVVYVVLTGQFRATPVRHSNRRLDAPKRGTTFKEFKQGMTMKLQSIHINRGYAANGTLRGEIVFKDDEETELKLKLDEQLSADILKLCADAIVRAGQVAANALTAEALQVTAIEHKSDE